MSYLLGRPKKAPTGLLPDRRDSLVGHWEGLIRKHHPKKGTPTQYELIGDITNTKRKVLADAVIIHRDGNNVVRQPFKLNGDFIHNRYLYLQYVSSEPQTWEFGTFIFSLSSDASELTGRFVGYGRRTQDIISGDTTLKKIT